MERFMELYETVYKDLYYLAYYYLGHSQDAEDVVSETVMKAYEKFHLLRDEKAFKSWICKILVNRCKDKMKKKKEIVSEIKEELSYEPSMDDLVITRELLSSLSEEERFIISLTVFGGYKGEEIAKLLNCRHSTVRSKYRRALKKLEKKVLEEEMCYGK